MFLNDLRVDSNDDLAVFWMSYVDRVEIILGRLRASREGDWMLHITFIRVMIHWVFAYDQINYARFLPVYYAQISQSPIHHPTAHVNFLDGGSTVQRKSQNPFGKIPADHAIDKTINKDTQTFGARSSI